MSKLHDTLWALCRKLPTDFTPHGDRVRDTAKPCADCSQGCRYFIPLQCESGDDWGVCANPKSPRAGLLTFEQQGCPQFESKDEPKTQPAPVRLADDEPTGGADTPLRKLTIDFNELLFAMEDTDNGLDEPVEYYLDTETGDILLMHEDLDDAEEVRELIESGLGERFRLIEPLESRDRFRIMENFVLSLPESRLKTRLSDALSRKKPFRHFRDIVHEDLAVRDQWFTFQNQALAQHARDLLASLGIEAA